MTKQELIEKLAEGYNELAQASTSTKAEPMTRSFYAGKAEAYLLVINALRTMEAN